MAESIPQAAIDAATAYESLMVPALFGQWAPKVADAARIGAGQRVLDVACGTGVLAREAASRSGTGGSVVGLDATPGMLAVARRLAPGLEWREGVAESLPFPDASFDAAVGQFGLMFFQDRAAALRDTLRVLKPGARLALAVFDVLERAPAYAAEVALLDRLAGPAAGDAVRAPFVLGERDALTALFGDAGVLGIHIDTVQGTARYSSVRVMVEADLRGWLPVMGVILSEAQIAQILAEAEPALGAHVQPGGTVAFDIAAHIVTATKA